MKLNERAILASALDSAIQRGLNRHDKYSDQPLESASRNLLAHEIGNSFWLALEDLGVSLEGDEVV